MRRIVSAATLIVATLFAQFVHADECQRAAPVTWGVTTALVTSRTPPEDASPVARARDLLERAKLLDEAAAADERVAADVAARLPQLRANAKAARDRADRAQGDEREVLATRAEALDADVVVSEAEVIEKKQHALENRRASRDFRARAIKLVREPAQVPTPAECSPPFSIDENGRKIFHIQCFR